MRKLLLFLISVPAFLLTALCGHAQSDVHPGSIDVSEYSSIYFDHTIYSNDQIHAIIAEHHHDLLARDPQWDLKRSQYEWQVQQLANSERNTPHTQSVLTIPVVVHIVYNTSVQNIPDAAVYSEIQVLNEDFGRYASDTTDTPPPFDSIAANTGIQFCLAQRDPNGSPSTGIERRQTYVTQFGNDDMKSFATGGLDQWDPTRYLNIWVCYTGGVCWGEFPTGTTSPTFGVVMNYFYFGSNYTSYGTFPYLSSYLDRGEIVVHEVGHCLNLYHIWGDDNGACTGTDYCADTPDQADASSNCLAFPAYDACTTSGNGIMFENYMDYTDDDCLNLFTQGQSARMNAVLSMAPYNALTTSNGCVPAPMFTTDAAPLSIVSPNGNTCTSITPTVILKNWGVDTLFSCDLNYFFDANAPAVYNWTGVLPSLATDTIYLSPVTLSPGAHSFTAATSSPNGISDDQPANDQVSTTFNWLGTGTSLPFFQGFEAFQFVPAGWSLSNPDGSNTWARTTVAASSGIASAMMDNIGYYYGYGMKDEMQTMTINLSSVPQPVLAFDEAYTWYHQTNPAQYYHDTLTILISTDCGQTFSIIYKKGGAQLATVVPGNNDPAFIPTSSQWRTEYVSLSPYQFCTNAIFIFRNTSGWGNELYLDNINIDDQLSVANHSDEIGFELYPDPAKDELFIRVDRTLSEKAIVRILDVTGRIVSEKEEPANSGAYIIDLFDETDGIYFVQLTTENGVAIRKFIINK